MKCCLRSVALLALISSLAVSVSAQTTPATGQSDSALQTAVTQQVNQQGGRPVQVLSPEQAVGAGVAKTPQAPFGPLSEAEQNFLDQVLKIWEQRTDKITHYECDFVRWVYRDQPEPETIATGVLKYMKPDKGLFRVDQLQTIAQRSPKPEYRVDPANKYGEYWICDGEWVHILDRNNKKAERIQLPPSMRGQGIYRSPLPFVFGVKAAELKQRYWLRPITPPAGDDSVWLEAWPKRADDAGNYSRVQIVLDRKDILPAALIVFLPNWDPQNGKRPREVYEFKNRKDSIGLLDQVKQTLFRQEFINTDLPADWSVIEQPY
ncbi:MAG: TIGR03009 domain-containing protein, partial [Planctomycetota bacterium]